MCRIANHILIIALFFSFSFSLPSCNTGDISGPSNPTFQERLIDFWGNYPELGEGRVPYTVLPIDTSYIDEILPLGHLFPPGHPVPTTHTYWILNRYDYMDQVSGFNKPIRAPANGVITKIIYTKWSNHPDYSVYIRHTNSFLTIFNHLSSINENILNRIGSQLKEGYDGNKIYVPVQAGDTIGKTSADFIQSAALDMGSYDRNVLSYIHPEKYPLPMQHAISPLDNFTTDLKEFIFRKVKRISEPRGGKYDFDIPGRLSGNWFYEGTDGWTGSDGHKNYLSFAYDVYDPQYLRISTGERLGGGLYRIKNNAPDFKDISFSSGKIIFYLFSVREGDEFFGRALSQYIAGTLLVQMINEEKIKVELFDGEIKFPTFTNNAKTYTR